MSMLLAVALILPLSGVEAVIWSWVRALPLVSRSMGALGSKLPVRASGPGRLKVMVPLVGTPRTREGLAPMAFWTVTSTSIWPRGSSGAELF